MGGGFYKASMKNDLVSFGSTAAELHAFLLKTGMAGKTICNISLAFEEMATNVLKYSYDDAEEHFLDIRIEIGESCVIMTLIDDGHEFDPTNRPAPDIGLDLLRRPLGGLGIYLTGKVSESMEYSRTGGRNILKITIKK